MKRSIHYLDWHNYIKELGAGIHIMDDEFAMLDNIPVLSTVGYPFKFDVTVIAIYTKGATRGTIGLNRYVITAPCIVTLSAGEIIQNEYISDDFEGLFIVLSKHMTNSFNISSNVRMPLILSIRDNPVISLKGEEFDLLKSYYFLMKRTVKAVESDSRKKIMRLFMKAFYIILNTHLQKEISGEDNNFVKQFLKLVETHYKTERAIGFYAELMHITPKYLSRIIKQNTSKSAKKWIDSYVMLEAKTLLKSTGLSIQQISDKLNFTDQSVFGRYFKHLERRSPRKYRSG
jgi:AraC-like DNA-binding protein